MQSKTPQFDSLMDEIFNALVPRTRTCRQSGVYSKCENEFTITKEDIEFLKTFRVPPPTLCPACRRFRRLAFANYTTLYKRKCDAPGHSEMMIANIPESYTGITYDFDYYWSDEWSALQYGKTIIQNQSFFEQIGSLLKDVPQPAITRDKTSTDSDYTLYGGYLKNCYYTFGGLEAEDVYYSNWPLYTKDSMDLFLSLKNDFCYEGVFPEECYNCNFAYFSKSCLDCSFIYDCRNSSNCFGCVNLRNKKFCFFNEQLTEDEYKKRMSEINLGDREVCREYKEKFWKLVKKEPMRSTRNDHSVDVVGNFIEHSKNCYKVFWGQHCENLRFADFVLALRDSMDVSISAKAEKLYETACVNRESANVKFSVNCKTSTDSEYLFNCNNCSHCFGCVGLSNKSYCIFNIEYTPEKYYELLDQLKSAMLQVGEYGEFFPISMSPFPVNGTFAGIMSEIGEEETVSLGGWWHDEPDRIPKDLEIIDSETLPKDSADVSEDVLDKAIQTPLSKKPFRIVPFELEFYKRKKLPLPDKHPYDRMIDHFDIVNRFNVEHAVCASCGKEIDSIYGPERGFNLYCEDCYNKEII